MAGFELLKYLYLSTKLSCWWSTWKKYSSFILDYNPCHFFGRLFSLPWAQFFTYRVYTGNLTCEFNNLTSSCKMGTKIKKKELTIHNIELTIHNINLFLKTFQLKEVKNVLLFSYVTLIGLPIKFKRKRTSSLLLWWSKAKGTQFTWKSCIWED